MASPLYECPPFGSVLPYLGYPDACVIPVYISSGSNTGRAAMDACCAASGGASGLRNVDFKYPNYTIGEQCWVYCNTSSNASTMALQTCLLNDGYIPNGVNDSVVTLYCETSAGNTLGFGVENWSGLALLSVLTALFVGL